MTRWPRRAALTWTLEHGDWSPLLSLDAAPEGLRVGLQCSPGPRLSPSFRPPCGLGPPPLRPGGLSQAANCSLEAGPASGSFWQRLEWALSLAIGPEGSFLPPTDECRVSASARRTPGALGTRPVCLPLPVPVLPQTECSHPPRARRLRPGPRYAGLTVFWRSEVGPLGGDQVRKVEPS